MPAKYIDVRKVWGAGFHAGKKVSTGAVTRWAVIQRETGLVDGWYYRHDDAKEMVQFWRTEYPQHTHELIGQAGTEWQIGSGLDKRLNEFWLMDLQTRPHGTL